MEKRVCVATVHMCDKLSSHKTNETTVSVLDSVAINTGVNALWYGPNHPHGTVLAEFVSEYT